MVFQNMKFGSIQGITNHFIPIKLNSIISFKSKIGGILVSKWKENASITHGIKVLKRKESGSQRRNDSRSSYILLIAWFYHFRIHLALFGEVEALYTPWPTNSNPRKLSVTYLRKFSIVLRGHIENNPNVCLVECSIMKMTKSQPHKIAQMKQENQRSKAYVMIPFLC